MLKKLTYPVLFALFMVFAASCQKEDVKPFNGGNSGTCGFGEQRDGGDDPGAGTTGGGTTGGGGTVTGDDPTGTGTTGEGGDEGGGITDGGNSSEHDSKGKRGKKP